MLNGHHSWKALILAAGYGTRLRPYTDTTPKAMFTLNGKPLVDRAILRLIAAGCSEIIINTHHLHRQIERFIADQKYRIPVHTCYEPEILGTGGAIQNAAGYFNDHPFMVFNSDIITDIDLGKVMADHLNHATPVTMVLVDAPRFNTVIVDQEATILGFEKDFKSGQCDFRRLTFTGIQVIDPEVIPLIPKGTFSSSIDTYRRMIADGQILRAHIIENGYWQDIGTPQTYWDEAVRHLAKKAFASAFDLPVPDQIIPVRLAGDGSDRGWHRLSIKERSLIMADHGIRRTDGPMEVDAFIDIGRHLKKQGVAVPTLSAWDRFSGLVMMEDLGDEKLQTVVQKATVNRIEALYKRAIDGWVTLAIKGIEGFDTKWTYQTAVYDKSLIIKKECHYFIDAFVKGYLGMTVDEKNYEPVFEQIADGIMANTIPGLIHRDCQSRNIMVKNNRLIFIDYQGARPGPVQYDLASLLRDPYVTLPQDLQRRLYRYAVNQMRRKKTFHADTFDTGYRYCALSRCLQILGAFGYLATVKNKPFFEAFIPAALHSISQTLEDVDQNEFLSLKSLIEYIKLRLKMNSVSF